MPNFVLAPTLSLNERKDPQTVRTQEAGKLQDAANKDFQANLRLMARHKVPSELAVTHAREMYERRLDQVDAMLGVDTRRASTPRVSGN